MIEKDLTKNINEAKMIAKELNDLLHKDAFQRLQLTKDYSYETGPQKWTQNLYQRCQLAEALCRKLNSVNS